MQKGEEIMANFYKKSNQLGRSMIEMLGVLAIIGVLSVGGIAGYSKAMARYNINKALEQISMIIANVQALFSNAKNYTSLGEKAYTLGVFPDDMQQNGDSETIAKNVFGLGTWVYGTENYWVIDYYIPNREVCIAIATQDWGKRGTLFKGEVYIPNKAPISIYEASEACGNSVDGENTFVRLMFK